MNFEKWNDLQVWNVRRRKDFLENLILADRNDWTKIFSVLTMSLMRRSTMDSMLNENHRFDSHCKWLMKLNDNRYRIDRIRFRHFLTYIDHQDLRDTLNTKFAVDTIVANSVTKIFLRIRRDERNLFSFVFRYHDLDRTILSFDHIRFHWHIDSIYAEEWNRVSSMMKQIRIQHKNLFAKIISIDLSKRFDLHGWFQRNGSWENKEEDDDSMNKHREEEDNCRKDRWCDNDQFDSMASTTNTLEKNFDENLK